VPGRAPLRAYHQLTGSASPADWTGGNGSPPTHAGAPSTTGHGWAAAVRLMEDLPAQDPSLNTVRGARALRPLRSAARARPALSPAVFCARVLLSGPVSSHSRLIHGWNHALPGLEGQDT